MFAVYSLLIGFTNTYLKKIIKKDTFKIIYIVFCLMFPLVYFIDAKIEYSEAVSFLNSKFSFKMFLTTYFFSSGLYWLIKVIKDNSVSLPVIKSEGYMLGVFVLSGLEIKILLSLLYSGYLSVKVVEDTAIIKTRYIICILLLLTCSLNHLGVENVSLVIYFVVFTCFFLSKEFLYNDLYLMVFITGVIHHLGIVEENYAIFLLVVWIIKMFWNKLEDVEVVKYKETYLNPILENPIFLSIQNVADYYAKLDMNTETIEPTRRKFHLSKLPIRQIEVELFELIILLSVGVMMLWSTKELW